MYKDLPPDLRRPASSSEAISTRRHLEAARRIDQAQTSNVAKPL
jgi:hypothetical protein